MIEDRPFIAGHERALPQEKIAYADKRESPWVQVQNGGSVKKTEVLKKKEEFTACRYRICLD